MQGLLREVGVRLVLVAAMSETHDPFADLASAVKRWQGITVVAMTPWHSSVPHAASVICLSPVRGCLPLVMAPSRASSAMNEGILGESVGAENAGISKKRPDTPAVCFFSPRDCTCHWTMCDV